MTKPGTRLRFGQAARVPLSYRESFSGRYAEGVIEVTMHPIRRMPASRLEGNYDKESRKLLKKLHAYYSRIDIRHISGDLSGVIVHLDTGVRSRNREPEFQFLGIPEVEGCPVEYPEGKDGEEWHTCAVAVGTRSSPIVGFQWDEVPYGSDIYSKEDGTTEFDKYYDLGPITWR